MGVVYRPKPAFTNPWYSLGSALWMFSRAGAMLSTRAGGSKRTGSSSYDTGRSGRMVSMGSGLTSTFRASDRVGLKMPWM